MTGKPIDSRVLFVTTSPRTPSKMIPEIRLLAEEFLGEKWNKENQVAFMQYLKNENFFNGQGDKDPAFSARDRINRAPKALGFVKLSPVIELTPAGEELIRTKRTEEIFLRQLLKFQLPSPYHKQKEDRPVFWIKPYLELFRLIRHFGTLRFDELMIFGLQLVDYREFDNIVAKIEQFRIDRVKYQGNYKVFRGEYLKKELIEIYSEEIATGKTKTRESSDNSIEKFISTKASNLKDYTDACFRYLRATGMVNISSIGKSISIVLESIDDVDYFLNNTEQAPCFINDENNYAEYLGNNLIPNLLIDNRELLLAKLKKEFAYSEKGSKLSIMELKDIFDAKTIARKEQIISTQISEVKDYKFYDDIQNTFTQIESKTMYDAPLMLEWNTWRAMTMIDGGNIKANLKFDDYGNPMSTAQGNMSDIVCDYGEFGLCVEVTLQVGQRQYEAEGEPVARHLAKLKKETNKAAYCLFIAPTINDACIAHFYALHKMNISYYGGTSVIIPLSLSLFRKMIEDSYKADYIPNPSNVRSFFESSTKIALETNDEKEWYKQIEHIASQWLSLH